MTSKDDILLLIPQRPPFVMIDELLFSDGLVTRTAFKIEAGNVFVVNNEFSEAGLMENIAQTAAARAGFEAHKSNERVAEGYIGAVKNLEIFDLPQINDELITEVKIENHVFNVTVISGKVWCQEKLMAQCEMKIFTHK